VFEYEEEAMDAVENGDIKSGDAVVIRNEGPRRGPDMREMLQVTGAIVGGGHDDDVVMITDARFSGGHADRWSATLLRKLISVGRSLRLKTVI